MSEFVDHVDRQRKQTHPSEQHQQNPTEPRHQSNYIHRKRSLELQNNISLDLNNASNRKAISKAGLSLNAYSVHWQFDVLKVSPTDK